MRRRQKAKPRPGELLWTLRKGGKTAPCELRYNGEYGVEAQFFRDGEFFSGRRFDTKHRRCNGRRWNEWNWRRNDGVHPNRDP
jgi:hypothetical protein